MLFGRKYQLDLQSLSLTKTGRDRLRHIYNANFGQGTYVHKYHKDIAIALYHDREGYYKGVVDRRF
eukprot:Pgem_evm2s19793